MPNLQIAMKTTRTTQIRLVVALIRQSTLSDLATRCFSKVLTSNERTPGTSDKWAELTHNCAGVVHAEPASNSGEDASPKVRARLLLAIRGKQGESMGFQLR